MTPEQQVDELNEEISILQGKVATIVTAEFDAWKPKKEQKETLSDLFWKWINEGFGEDYYPDLAREDVECPWFVQEQIDICSDCVHTLISKFKPKGIHFE